MTDRRFIEELIRAVNEYRAYHQVKPLKYNASISAMSQRWADQLARTGMLQHNPNSLINGEPLGENCAMKWSSALADYTGQEVADKWYDEINNYDFQRHTGKSTGNFTQMVWKSSREIGIGRSHTADGKWFIVVNFYPAGNNAGHYVGNVFPPQQQKVQKSRQPRGFLNQMDDSNSAKNLTFPRRHTSRGQLSSPFRPISPTTSDDGASEDFDYEGSRHQQPGQKSRHLSQPQPQQQRNQQTLPKATNAGVIRSKASQQEMPPKSVPAVKPSAKSGNAFVVLQRTTETKESNNGTLKKVTEIRRDRQGQLSTVMVETMEPQGDGILLTGFDNQIIPKQLAELSLNDDHHHSVFQKPKRSKQDVQAVDGPTDQRRKPKDRNQDLIGQNEKFAADVVRQHNIFRRLHGNVGDLTLNQELSKMATDWAQHLAQIRILQHSSSKYRGVDCGENIGFKYSDRNEGFSGSEMVSLWYSEMDMFNFKDPETCAETCGHFTQVVWRGSREIGVGRSFTDGGRRMYIVCLYHPPGNFIGRFDDNVLPPDSSTIRSRKRINNK